MATKGCDAITSAGYKYHFVSRSEAAKWLIQVRELDLQANTVVRKINAAIREGTIYETYNWCAAGEGEDYINDDLYDSYTYMDDAPAARRKNKRRRRANENDDGGYYNY